MNLQGKEKDGMDKQDKLIAALDRTLSHFQQWASLPSSQQGANSAHQVISVNAGGIGVWVAVWLASICCAVMLTLTLISRADQIDQKRRLDLANDKLSVILQWAPELAKKVDQATNKKGENAP